MLTTSVHGEGRLESVGVKDDYPFYQVKEYTQLKKLMVSQLKARLLQRYEGVATKDVKITFEGMDKFKVPKDAVFFQMKIPPKVSVLGRNGIPINFLTHSKRFIKRRTILATVSARAPFVYAARSISVGTVITKDHLKTVREKLYNKPVYAIINMDKVLGKEVLFEIQNEAPIYSWMVKTIPLVHKGVPVKVRLMVKQISIETQGIPVDDAALGEIVTIRLKNKGQKLVKAEVIGTNNVKVQRN
ncbi:flagellar basal body P-ring formation protein FlgA [bacterium]|nr:flagellar basal body P-ring formation protein FlgA [bacterium]